MLTTGSEKNGMRRCVKAKMRLLAGLLIVGQAHLTAGWLEALGLPFSPKLSIELTFLPFGLTKLLVNNNLSGLTVTIENPFW